MAKKNSFINDVSWFIPNKKRPIAYSSKATSDLIVELSKIPRTIQDVRESITYDSEAKTILDIYIKKRIRLSNRKTIVRMIHNT